MVRHDYYTLHVNLIRKILTFTFFLIVLDLSGQKSIRGLITDSVTLEGLSQVHVTVKHTLKGTATNEQGFFTVSAKPTDTLLFTRVGYTAIEIPLFFEEDVLWIRLREKVNVLQEITIRSTRLTTTEIIRAARALPRPMPEAFAMISPIDYFSKWQREKRKLLKLIEENNRIVTYLEVVNDQELREELMEAHALTENQYYDLLAKFNQQSGNVLYSTSAAEIAAALKEFFEKNTH